MSACEQLVKLNGASWFDSTKKSVKVFFRKYDDVFGRFKGLLERIMPKDLKKIMREKGLGKLTKSVKAFQD